MMSKSEASIIIFGTIVYNEIKVVEERHYRLVSHDKLNQDAICDHQD